MPEIRPDYQPRLRWWSHAWRFVLMLAISAAAWGPLAAVQYHRSAALTGLDWGLGLVAYVVVHGRRRHPVATAALTSVASALSGIAAGPAVLAAASLATRRRWREIVPIALLNLASSTAYAYLYPSSDDPSWLILVASVIATGAVVSWGMYVGSRRELLWTLRHRAQQAEAEQEERAQQARSAERSRIAREMHDVLAHRITKIAMHAGALGFREDLDAAAMRSSAQVIQQQAHEALTDLRGVLGVLREPAAGGPAAPRAPQPTYADLPLLVDEARDSGMYVEFDDLLPGDVEADVPDPVGRALYRIVQEGMTNARKHAPGATLQIRLDGRPEDGVHLSLGNPLGFGSRTPGAGLGLVGLAERAALLGGTLEHRRERDRFVLETWLPWTPR